MSAELIGILAVGAALAGVMVSLFAWIRADVAQLRREVAALRERMGALEQRMARLEGMLEVLSQAIGIKRADAAE